MEPARPDRGGPESLVKQGTAYESQGFIDRAMDAYKESIRMNPQYAEGHARLGVAFARKSMLDQAIGSLSQAVKLSPQTDRFHYDLAVAYDKKELYDRAIEEYQTVIKLNPSHLEAYNNLGTIYNLRDQLDEAIDAYRRALRIKPEVSRIHYNLGIVYVRKGLFHHAIQSYLEAIRLDPRLPEAFNNLGVAYSQTWQFDKAAEAFRKAVDLRADMREARENLSETQRDHKLMESLIEEYKEFLAANPDHSDTWAALGIAYARNSKIDLALAALSQAQKLQPMIAAGGPAGNRSLPPNRLVNPASAARTAPSHELDLAGHIGQPAKRPAAETNTTAAAMEPKATVKEFFPPVPSTSGMVTNKARAAAKDHRPPETAFPSKREAPKLPNRSEPLASAVRDAEIRTPEIMSPATKTPERKSSVMKAPDARSQAAKLPEVKGTEVKTVEARPSPSRTGDISVARISTSKPLLAGQSAESVKPTGPKAFALQIAVHREREKADEVAQGLRSRGITAQVFQADTSDRGVWYQVRIGTFPTFVDARDFGEKLKTGNIIEDFTVTRTGRTNP
ncbi:MAG: tetratricopeptide repeat protein [Acidobacteria bacterium]|nr:tetratricopeptide repeat protein [Acidobacteriota bacterium]MBI3657985.1 tetratricopeptide repeat protein [Acidobacteriota bacterium]